MMELRTLADWVIKPAILATGGVSQVTNIGGELKQYQILADPQKMDFYGGDDGGTWKKWANLSVSILWEA